ncbi:hypothetical protein B1813_10665 [Saccharomonospora piscinae]|uniref:HTH tetR-type domain-containing protein n=1 Tax=Saccharomonospora piscinae TaxID=687388 RepID=A0A1V9A6A2_SACPI|nr:TetR/AcrR family transcriptional regulator [Saccharomonospora piscinae]OQO92621.1 hypothetical protein B1813_10665 [Saccharomonospora piscinae]
MPTGAKPMPLTQRGRNTRTKLLEAARRVFERDGFLDVKITDITAEAGLAAGSFYTYFESKEDTFRVLLEGMRDELLQPVVRDEDGPEDPIESIRRATQRYFETYRRNVGLMRVLEQMTAVDSHFRELRIQRASVFADRNARNIRRLQDEGRADPTVPAELAALTLSSMVSRVAQVVFNFGYPVDDVDQLVDVVVRLWVKSLDIR